MKKTILIFLLTFVIFEYTYPQCPDYLIFTNQDQIDNFPVDYPNCSELDGYLIIGGENITNLDGLITLTSIGDYVSIHNNPILSDISGLGNLTSIGGHFVILNNNQLINLSGLEYLTTLNGYLYIGNNNSLVSLAGLENLSMVGGWQFGISENNALIDLTTFNNLNQIGGSLFIENNNSLSSLNGLDSLFTVGGSVTINNCISLTDFNGLEGIQTIGENLALTNIYFAQDITGFENLNSIGGDLLIHKCNSLIDLSGLINLTLIGGTLEISENNTLESLYGADSIYSESISNLIIKFNPLLSFCHVQSICNYLASPNGDISIISNSTGCNNYLEVVDACTVKIDENSFSDQITIYPNPANNKLFINNKENGEFEVMIYNQFGQEIFSKNNLNSPIDISMIPSGFYIIRINSNISNYNEVLIIE